MPSLRYCIVFTGTRDVGGRGEGEREGREEGEEKRLWGLSSASLMPSNIHL